MGRKLKAMKKYFLLFSALCFILMGRPAMACTGLVVQDGARVLVGNNEDWFNPRSKIWFIQPVGGRYGSVFFGFDNFWPQGGMNQKGLFFDAFALKAKAVDVPEAKPRFRGILIKEVMATCATVAEALALIDRYSLYFMDQFQLFFADATGDAAIVEADAVIRKQGDHQIVTNFRQSATDPDKIACWRYLTAEKLLADCRGEKQNCVKDILEATHQEGDFPTLYSNVYDLNARRVHVYHFHNYQEEVVIDLEQALATGTGVMDLPALFPPNEAARAFRARCTDLKKEYVHDAPRFVVRYPLVYVEAEPLDESQVLFARSRYGQVPVLTVSVMNADTDMPLARAGGECYAPRLREVGTQVTILSNRPTRLADGSAAYETRVAWQRKDRTRLTSLVVSAVRDDKLIQVALHHTGELDYLKHIPYSLRFD
jgi:hypothetical protein